MTGLGVGKIGIGWLVGNEEGSVLAGGATTEDQEMIADLINGCFELTAGLLLSLNVRRLFKDKQVRGVCLAPVMLMAAWGYWNLFFYPIVGATFSFLAGIPVAVVNTVWGIQIFFYGRSERRMKKVQDEYCAVLCKFYADNRERGDT